MILVLDYNVGNVGAIKNMIQNIGYKCEISNSVEAIKKADKLILPGVGSFDNGIKNLRDLGIIPQLNEKVLHEKTPILGICLGMQLMARSSSEGNESGLKRRRY